MNASFYAERFRGIKSILVMLAALELITWICLLWFLGLTGYCLFFLGLSTLKVVFLQHYAMYCEFYEYELRRTVTGHPHR